MFFYFCETYLDFVLQLFIVYKNFRRDGSRDPPGGGEAAPPAPLRGASPPQPPIVMCAIHSYYHVYCIIYIKFYFYR